jgi:hypothetical protein
MITRQSIIALYNKQRLAFDELRKQQEQEMDDLLRQYAIDNGCPQVGDVLKVHGINRWVKVKRFSPTFVRGGVELSYYCTNCHSDGTPNSSDSRERRYTYLEGVPELFEGLY